MKKSVPKNSERKFIFPPVKPQCFLKCISIFVFMLLLTTGLQAQTPVAANGKLSVSGKNLINKDGKAIQLRGMSSHGPQWFGDCYNFNSLSALTYDWGVDVFRLAMYVEENGYVTDPENWKKWVDNMVDLCGQFGIYCLIDWHVLTPGDPNANLTQAKEFWDYISKKHAGKDHVIYEICNEPNGVEWPRVKEYAEAILPIIRINDPSTIVIIGTPNWSQDVDKAAASPLTGTNLMYALHFYSGTHLGWLRDKATAAMNAGLALFVTEFGTSQASGDGGPYLDESTRWMDFMQTNKISWCNWSYSDKNEISAALKEGACGSDWNNTTISGEYIKNKILIPADSWANNGGNIPPVVEVTTPDNNSYYEIGDEITLSANATDKDGTVSSVKYFAGTTQIGESTITPYTVKWKPASESAFKVTAVATDNQNASNTSLAITVNVVTQIIQDPYPNKIPHPIPGTVSAVHYDDGGEGIAYHDVDAANKGVGGIRPNEGVDTEGGDGTGNVGYVIDGEWLEYTVNVASAGTYSLVLRFASQPGGGKFHLEFDEVDKTGPISVGSSGSWGTFQEVTVNGISLEAGKQVMRMDIDKGDFNFSKFIFSGGGTVIPVTGISVNPTTVTIKKGATSALSAAITPTNATNKTVTWSSSNTAIATVNSSGLVTAVSKGTTVITAKSSVPSITDNCNVTVSDSAVVPTKYTLSVTTVGKGSVSLNPTGGSYDNGTIVTLTATADAGNTFENWIGDASGTNNIVTVTMNSNKSVTANFKTQSTGGGCVAPVAITLPQTQDGAAELCWETTEDVGYVNSWNLEKFEINGVDYTNKWSNSMPPKKDGKYQFYYKGVYAWSHVEITGSNGSLKFSGTEELSNDALKIYPNPASDFINIKGLGDVQKLSISSTLGQVIYQQEVSTEVELTLPLNQFKSGSYILNIHKTNGSLESQMLLIK